MNNNSQAVAPTRTTIASSSVNNNNNNGVVDSYTYGVAAPSSSTTQNVKEKLYDEDDEWTPSVGVIALLVFLVLAVGAGVGVGIYFANENRGKNQPPPPTVEPTLAPTMAPSEPASYPLCRVCEDENEYLTLLSATVALPGVNDNVNVTCFDLQTLGLNGNISTSVCTNQVQQPSVAETCGCVRPPTEAPTVSSSPTIEGATSAPLFVCPICGSADLGISNPTASVDIPGLNGLSTTCQQLEDQAQQGSIDPDRCYQSNLQNLVQLACGCSFRCNICGPSDGDTVGEITNPDGVVQLPLGQGERTCASLVEAGEAGDINEEQCAFLQNVAGPCECVYSNNIVVI